MPPTEPGWRLRRRTSPAKILGGVRTGGRSLVLAALSVVGCSFGFGTNAGTGPDVADGTEGMATSSGGDGVGDGGLPSDDGDATSGVGADGTTSGGSSGATDDGDIETGGESTGPTLCTDEGWWGPLWTHRRRIFINNEGLGGAIGDFPVLVRLNADRVDYSETQDGGEDLRFIADDGVTVLSHEVELWNESGDSYVWLKVPVIPAGDQGMPTIDLYFGNDGAVDASEPAAVWTSGFTSVHHMGSMADATGTGHDGNPSGGPVDAEGLVGRGTLFDGVDDHIVLPDENHYDFEDNLTVEVVLRVDAFDIDQQAVVTKGDAAWRLERDSSGNGLRFANTGFLGNDNLSTDANINDGQWHVVAMTLGGDDKRIYVDGSLDNDKTYLDNIDETNEVVMIGENAGSAGRYFEGVIDEVRISGNERSSTWLALSNRSIRDQGLVLYGELVACTDL